MTVYKNLREVAMGTVGWTTAGVLFVFCGAGVWFADECLNINENWKRVPLWKRVVHTLVPFAAGVATLRIVWAFM